MKIVNVIQGSDEWHEVRSNHNTASEAPVMASKSKQMKRNELLYAKYTGESKEVSWWVQRFLFDKGHAAEAAARPIAEEIIGQELYPVTGISEDHPKLLASLDGCTMLEDVIFEHKLWNEDLAASVRSGSLAEHYLVQMDQQLLVSGAEKCLFMVSDGTRENCVWCWHYPSQERFDRLVAGWNQFDNDLAAYQPVEQKVAPQGEAPDELPVLRIDLTGAVTASNLPDFKAQALAVIEAISTQLVTDKDFADAEKTVKFLDKGEKQLEASKKSALEQTASIDELFRTIDELNAKMRDKRLALNKLVKAEKENRRLDIQRQAEGNFTAWLRSEVVSPVTPAHSLDVAGAMKGKKTIASLQAAADDEVARAKVEAQQDAKRLASNAKLLEAQAEGYDFLFADRDQLIQKPADDLAATIKARIADHKEREQQRQDAERERIRQEEEAKAQQQEQAPATQQAPIDTGRLNAAAEKGAALKPASQVETRTVTISAKEYDQLLHNQAMLYALLDAGVDNWSGYELAMASLHAA